MALDVDDGLSKLMLQPYDHHTFVLHPLPSPLLLRLYPFPFPRTPLDTMRPLHVAFAGL